MAGQGGPQPPPAVLSLPDYPTFEAASRHIIEMCTANQIPIWNVNTRLETNFRTVDNIDTYLADMDKTTNETARDVVVNTYLSKHLRNLICHPVSFWLMQKKVVTKCLEWFETTDAVRIIELARASAQVADCTPNQLQSYVDATFHFRKHCHSVLSESSRVFATMGNEAEKKLTVPESELQTLNRMLTNIVVKRNRLLGIEGRQAGAEAGPQHYADFEHFFHYGVHNGAIGIMARRATGFGIQMVDGVPRSLEIVPGEKNGVLLMTTAILHHRQIIRNPEWLPTYNGNDNAVRTAVEIATHEVNAIQAGVATVSLGRANATAATAYRQQLANLDIIFNTFLWAKIAGVTVATAPKLNVFLNCIGRRIIGAAKVEEAVNSSDYKVWAQYFNKTKSPYMPPYAITGHRIYDFVAVFGVLNILRIQDSLAKPGISPRYLVHLKSESGIAMKLMGRLWLLEEKKDIMNGKNSEETIRMSEHFFHQLLINRLCAYTNSSGISGNIFDMELVIGQPG